MSRLHKAVLAACFLLPTACGQWPSQRIPVAQPLPRPTAPPPITAPSQAPRPAPEPTTPGVEVYPLPQGPTGAPAPLEPPVPDVPPTPESGVFAPPAVHSDSPPVVALLGEAEAGRQRGDLENVAAVLESAIRLEPRNAGLWLQLADVRLRQGQPILAQDLARKGIALAGSDQAMAREGWLLLSRALHTSGDAAGAAQAERRALGF